MAILVVYNFECIRCLLIGTSVELKQLWSYTFGYYLSKREGNNNKPHTYYNNCRDKGDTAPYHSTQFIFSGRIGLTVRLYTCFIFRSSMKVKKDITELTNLLKQTHGALLTELLTYVYAINILHLV